MCCGAAPFGTPTPPPAPRPARYDVWDVTELVVPGCNALGVMLGAGWYAQRSIKSGPKSLQVLLSVDTSDGARTYFASSTPAGALSTVTGGATALPFVITPGPVVADDIYQGETYDAQLQQEGWASCHFTNATAWAATTATSLPPNAGARCRGGGRVGGVGGRGGGPVVGTVAAGGCGAALPRRSGCTSLPRGRLLCSHFVRVDRMQW
jgi:hypothetical protein